MGKSDADFLITLEKIVITIIIEKIQPGLKFLALTNNLKAQRHVI
jgi:hypothetical protein